LTDTDKGSSTGATPVPPRGGKNSKKNSGRPTSSQSKSSGKSGSRPQQSGAKSSSGRRAAEQAKRRRRNIIAAVAVGVAVVVVAVVVILGLSSGKAAAAPRTPLSDADAQHLQSIPISTLVEAANKVDNLNAPSALTGAPLTSGGKPEMLYIGAEFCPICATERWPMMVALSHFGTFTDVKQTSSAVSDGDIPTLSFYGSSFDSPDLVFTPVETLTNQPQGNSYKPLQSPTPAQAALWNKELNGQESFPFINIAGKYLLNTSQFPDTVLQGASFAQIMSDVGDNSTTIGLNIDAAAGTLIRYICNTTGDKPAATCSAVAGVKAPTTASSTGPSSSAG
jgi:Domain of unknown function (DUF929)